MTAAAGGFRVERARDSSMIPPDCVDVVELTSIKSFNLGSFDFILEKKIMKNRKKDLNFDGMDTDWFQLKATVNIFFV